VMLVLTFSPTPITHTSGREVWPELRYEIGQAKHLVRDEVQHLLQRKR